MLTRLSFTLFFLSLSDGPELPLPPLNIPLMAGPLGDNGALETLEEEEEVPAAVAATEDLRAGRMPPGMASEEASLPGASSHPNAAGPSLGGRRSSVSLGSTATLAVGVSGLGNEAAGTYRHDLMAQVEGTPQHILNTGTLKHVQGVFPPGVMHSLAARATARVLLTEEEIPSFMQAARRRRKNKKRSAVLQQVAVDVCVYVGQNAYAVVAEFCEAFELAGARAALEAEFEAALGEPPDSRARVGRVHS